MKIPFSPPDITEAEIEQVADALRSGWITTGPKTKELEREVAEFCGVNRAVCLNSQTACAEMTLRRRRSNYLCLYLYCKCICSMPCRCKTGTGRYPERFS